MNAGCIQKQLDCMYRGFYEIITHKAATILRGFCWHELQLLLCGQPTNNVSLVKSHTCYEGYTASSDVVVWLWETLKQFSQVSICVCVCVWGEEIVHVHVTIGI